MALRRADRLLDDTFSDCKSRSDCSEDVARDGNPIALQLAYDFQDHLPVAAHLDLTADVLWQFHRHLRSMTPLTFSAASVWRTTPNDPGWKPFRIKIVRPQRAVASD